MITFSTAKIYKNMKIQKYFWKKFGGFNYFL